MKIKLSEAITMYGDRELTEEFHDYIRVTTATGHLDAIDAIKEKKTPIDLSVLIESGIDCEFGDRHSYTEIDKLLSIGKVSTTMPYASNYSDSYCCRPRMNHIHACPEGFDKCPLPEGFRVGVYYRNPKALRGSILESGLNSHNYVWNHLGGSSDIIAFEALGLADGYCYPWETEDNDP